ncbi:hypothetical protein D3C76_721790 [compost metagenome]
MIADEARVDLVAFNDFEIEGFEQAFGGGAQGEVGFDVDHVPLHVAALDHGLELAVVGRTILHHGDAAGLAERVGPGLLLRILGAAAPTHEVDAFSRQQCLAGHTQQSRKKNRGRTFVQHHFHALIVVFMSGALECPPIGSSRSVESVLTVRSMEYHIMVFQTLCKHFAVPAISQKVFFLWI